MTRWSGWSWRFREDDFRVLSAEGPLAGAASRTGRSRTRSWRLSTTAPSASSASRASPARTPSRRRAPTPYPNPPHPPRRSSLIFERGAKAAGLHPFPVPIAINSGSVRRARRLHLGRRLPGLRLRDPRQSHFAVRLHPARARHREGSICARRARVFELSVGKDGRVRERRAISTRRAASRRCAPAHFVVSAARSARPTCCCSPARGAFRDGLANSSGLVGRHLTMHHHAAVRLVMDEPALGVTGIDGLPRGRRLARERSEARLHPRRRGRPRSTPSRASRSATP